MSKKQQLLDNLKNITKKEPEPIHYAIVYSNLENDRIYGYVNGNIQLVNKDYSIYKGKINKRSITCQGLDGTNFRSYVYETADGRWFDRAGLPIKKPNNLIGNNDSQEESTNQIA